MTPIQRLQSLPSERIPQHIAIIMDGNGRWAQEKGLPRNEGHRKGVENVQRIVEFMGKTGVKYLTLYAFSCENWNRPKEEINALMNLLEFFLKTQARRLHKHKVRLRVLGRLDDLPSNVRYLLEKVIEETKPYRNWSLNLALNYGARTEMVDAFRSFYKQLQSAGKTHANEIEWADIATHLYTHDIPDPDLIIRTSGELRISNFLLMQAAYAEFYFTSTYWPDFDPNALCEAICDYASRERRFGKTGDQIKEKS